MNNQLIIDDDAHYAGPSVRSEVINTTQSTQTIRYRFNVNGISEKQRVYWAEWWLKNVEGIPRSAYKSATITDEGKLVMQPLQKIEWLEFNMAVVKKSDNSDEFVELKDTPGWVEK